MTTHQPHFDGTLLPRGTEGYERARLDTEVLDLLLDMRSAAMSDAAIRELIDSEAQPAH